MNGRPERSGRPFHWFDANALLAARRLRDRLGLGRDFKKPPTGTGQCRRSLKPNRRPRGRRSSTIRSCGRSSIRSSSPSSSCFSSTRPPPMRSRTFARRASPRASASSRRRRGFDVNQTSSPTPPRPRPMATRSWSASSTPLVVAAIGIFFATILGFVVGIARLSKNWVVAKVAMVYVEVIRNMPLLLQLLFWYVAVLTSLPGPRQSLNAGAAFSSTSAASSCRSRCWRATPGSSRRRSLPASSRRSRSTSGPGGSRSRPGGSIRSG